MKFSQVLTAMRARSQQTAQARHALLLDYPELRGLTTLRLRAIYGARSLVELGIAATWALAAWTLWHLSAWIGEPWAQRLLLIGSLLPVPAVIARVLSAGSYLWRAPFMSYDWEQYSALHRTADVDAARTHSGGAPS